MSTEQNSPARLIVRIVLGLALATVLVLALLDYRAKSNATKTAHAWQEAIVDTIEEPALAQYIHGSPDVRTESRGYARTVHYTWPGIIRSYRVEVELIGGQESDGFVDKVTGPIND